MLSLKEAAAARGIDCLEDKGGGDVRGAHDEDAPLKAVEKVGYYPQRFPTLPWAFFPLNSF